MNEQWIKYTRIDRGQPAMQGQMNQLIMAHNATVTSLEEFKEYVYAQLDVLKQ